MKRPVYYWTGVTKTGQHEYIYLLGNPVIWWGLLVGVVVVALGWMRHPELFERHRGVSIGLGLLAGWMIDGETWWRFPSWRSAALYGGILVVAMADSPPACAWIPGADRCSCLV
jgi:hypothetical protein